MKHKLVKVEKCPVCESKKQEHFINAEDHNVSHDLFSIVQCGECKFLFTSPIPTENTIGEYYKSSTYVSHSDSKKGFINSVYHKVRSIAVKQKEQLALRYSDQKNILDVGCGTGYFLAHCTSQGWKTVGLEPDDSARKIAVSKNKIDARKLEELYTIDNESFDVITMWHVLEHVYNLNKDIIQLEKLLKKNGTLIVAVPNPTCKDAEHYKESWAGYDLPIHLYHFAPENIKQLFAKVNLELVEILPMKFDSYYVNMLSEKYKGGNILSGFWNGFKSNWAANSKNNKYASQIYILKKK